MKRCINPNCGVELDDNAKFCPECGTKQPTEKKCPKCGTVMAEKAKFCPECGFKMDGTGAAPKTNGISIGDNNAISAKDVIGGDKIEAQHYTVNNFMAAQKTEAEQKMDNISVKKMSKEYIRDEMNKAMNYEKQGDYYHAVEIYKELAADDNSDAVCAMLKLDLRKKFQLSGIERNQMLGKISEIANTGHPEALFVVGAYKLETDKATGLQYIYAAAQNHSNDAIDYLDDYFGWNEKGSRKAVTQESVTWFKKSSDYGSAKGKYLLGDCYLNGLVVDKDQMKAVQLFRISAEQGYSQSQYMLGRCYDNGWGVPKDYDEAKKCYYKAAEQNNADAQFSLGVGFKLNKNYSEAKKWLQKASENGNFRAYMELAEAYEERLFGYKDHKMAMKLYEKAAELGFAEAQGTLGEIYYKGLFEEEKNGKEAVKWLKMAAENGYGESQVTMASFYYSGEIVDKNIKEAVRYCRMKSSEEYFSYKNEMYDTAKNQMLANCLAILYFDEDNEEAYMKEALSLFLDYYCTKDVYGFPDPMLTSEKQKWEQLWSIAMMFGGYESYCNRFKKYLNENDNYITRYFAKFK